MNFIMMLGPENSFYAALQATADTPEGARASIQAACDFVAGEGHRLHRVPLLRALVQMPAPDGKGMAFELQPLQVIVTNKASASVVTLYQADGCWRRTDEPLDIPF
jgi:hypothetical protein